MAWRLMFVGMLALTRTVHAGPARKAKPTLTALCPSLQGVSISTDTGAPDAWQMRPDGYASDAYIVRVFDSQRAEIEIQSKADPRTYPLTIVGVEPEFITMVGHEVRRPVLITLYASGVLSYAQHRWNKVTSSPETKAFNARCKLVGALPKIGSRASGGPDSKQRT